MGILPRENLENLDSQECLFLHSQKETIFLSSLLIYPVKTKKILCSLQRFVCSSTVVNNKIASEGKRFEMNNYCFGLRVLLRAFYTIGFVLLLFQLPRQ